jgi:hypothetical protein
LSHIQIFPQALIQYRYGSNFKICELPLSLEYLIVNAKQIDNFEDLITATPILKYIKFTGGFNQNVKKFPPMIKYINLKINFDSQIDEFPPSLETLIFGNIYNQTLNPLPDTLISLNCGAGSYNKPFPKSLQNLIILKPVIKSHIPRSLKFIKCQNSYQPEIPNWVLKIVLL